MTQSIVDWAAEARTWGTESRAMAKLMFPAGCEAWDLDEEKDVD